jgi:hypothetical protein
LHLNFNQLFFMKPIYYLLPVIFLACLFACQPNPKSPVLPPKEAPEPTESVSVISIKREGGHAVVPNPRTISYLIERRIDGDLQPIFLTQIEDGGGNPRSEISFSMTCSLAAAISYLFEKIDAIKQTEFKMDGPAMVGLTEKTYSITRENGVNSKIVVQNGAAEPSIVLLDALVAQEMAAYNESAISAAGKAEKSLEGKVWQSDVDADTRISFRGGRMVTWKKDGEDPAKPYVSFRQWCPANCGRLTKNSSDEGLKAGFVCCMTLSAQDDECYAILECDKNKLEFIRLDDPNAKSQHFTLLRRG